MQYETEEEASAAVALLFQKVASRTIMTPTVCGRVMVANGLQDLVVIGFGGGGIYETESAQGEPGFTAVVSAPVAIALPPDIAASLAHSITEQLAQRASEDV